MDVVNVMERIRWKKVTINTMMMTLMILFLRSSRFLDIQEISKSALDPCDIDIRDEKLVNTEAEDNQDEPDKVKIHRPDNSNQDLLVSECVLPCQQVTGNDVVYLCRARQ